MIKFIIYEDKKEYREIYKNVILKIIGGSSENYDILEIDKYDHHLIDKIEKSDGRRIYILDIEVPGKSGLDLAREIRNGYNDWESQLIISTRHQHFQSVSFMARLLMLDFVSKHNNCENHLKESIIDAIRILNCHQNFVFTQDGELFQIPYQDILYIEKNKYDIYTTAYTKNHSQLIKMSIKKIEEQLKQSNRFFKTNRSYIVNLYNIDSINYACQTIKVGNKMIKAISRDNKKRLKERMESLNGS